MCINYPIFILHRTVLRRVIDNLGTTEDQYQNPVNFCFINFTSGAQLQNSRMRTNNRHW